MGRAIRVMVVDDTDHVRQMLTSMLTLDGFEVVDEAASGNEAVRRIEGADPDVVVIDYRTPALACRASSPRMASRSAVLAPAMRARKCSSTRSSLIVMLAALIV